MSNKLFNWPDPRWDLMKYEGVLNRDGVCHESWQFIGNGEIAVQMQNGASTMYGMAYGNRWISVKDKLPARSLRVLCFTKYGWTVVDSYSHSVGPYDNPTHWFDGSDGEYNVDVTHWMPLPEPPKL